MMAAALTLLMQIGAICFTFDMLSVTFGGRPTLTTGLFSGLTNMVIGIAGNIGMALGNVAVNILGQVGMGLGIAAGNILGGIGNGIMGLIGNARNNAPAQHNAGIGAQPQNQNNIVPGRVYNPELNQNWLNNFAPQNNNQRWREEIIFNRDMQLAPERSRIER